MTQVRRRRRRRRRRVRTLQPTFLFGALLFVVAAIALGIFLLWRGSRPYFLDVMVELGDPMPALSQFTTKYADADRVEMVTPSASVQLDKVGVYPITLRCGRREETVTLTVRDTTKPVVIAKNVTVAPGSAVAIEDFIQEIRDHSETTVSFLREPKTLDVYGEVPVTISVQDAYRNETIVECKVEYTWLKSEYRMEMGHVLTKEDLLLVEDVDEAVLEQAALDHITWFGVGTYEVGGDWNNETRVCTVTVVDTTAPDLQLKELSILPEERATVEDFIESLTDASRTESARLLTELVFGQVGSVQTVQIEATDASGNKTVKQTVLRIVKELPPEENETE